MLPRRRWRRRTRRDGRRSTCCRRCRPRPRPRRPRPCPAAGTTTTTPVHNLLATEERDDAHYSFLQGTQEQLGTHVAANDMCALDEWPSHARRNRAQLWNESDGQNKKGRGVLFVFRTKHLKRFKTKKMKLKVQFPVNIEAIFSRPHRKALRNATHHSLMGMDTWPNHQVVLKRIKSQFEEQARATAEIQKVNSELSHQVTELQDQLQAERESTQERINFERAERENLEESLKEEHADMERLLEEERRSTLKFEKNMMAKFAQLSQHTQTHQTASTTGTLGTRHNVIAPNTLIQAATIRMFRAMVSGSKD
ncbi:uncharacterized protein LOC125552688 isoform X13 [Triticum urartu]|uniref:uncharacterized protein LOC125552688 isoform X13 n=1 Tax=Triticum urartu TaxID=4572 RepID=UPI002043903D|nr:uncharacterized protein LOC125552688 isoform X13 [Triticum urartu]